EKVDFAGTYYRTDKARLYSPPVGRVPIWMSAGGPQSAALAGRIADGLILSVKVPAEAREQIIDPFRAAARDAGRPPPAGVAPRGAGWRSAGRSSPQTRARRGRPSGPGAGCAWKDDWRRSTPPSCGRALTPWTAARSSPSTRGRADPRTSSRSTDRWSRWART